MLNRLLHNHFMYVLYILKEIFKIAKLLAAFFHKGIHFFLNILRLPPSSFCSKDHLKVKTEKI